MRVVSLQPAREPVMCGHGPVRIGSARDDDIVLAGAGVAPHHVSIVADARGLVLAVTPNCQRVYVNARAVRERAVLRYGDTLTLGANKLLVTADVAPPQVANSANDEDAFPDEPVLLRLVSGAASGRGLSLQSLLHLGAGSGQFGELAFACCITRTAAGLVFESDSAVPLVNGWHCQRAQLAANDQIALGEHRLVVEAPGLQYAAYVDALPPARPAPVDTQEEIFDDVHHAGVGWLIAAAAMLAAIIALLLYFHI